LLFNQLNAEFFLALLQTRDQNTFLPGTICSIDNPQVIENWMGDMPLVDTTTGLRVVDPSCYSNLLAEVALNKNLAGSKTQAYHYPKVLLRMKHFDVIDSNCSGNLCDGLELYKGKPFD
jgi:hypothetical protein